MFKIIQVYQLLNFQINTQLQFPHKFLIKDLEFVTMINKKNNSIKKCRGKKLLNISTASVVCSYKKMSILDIPIDFNATNYFFIVTKFIHSFEIHSQDKSTKSTTRALIIDLIPPITAARTTKKTLHNTNTVKKFVAYISI